MWVLKYWKYVFLFNIYVCVDIYVCVCMYIYIYIFVNFILTPFDVCFCVDFILFLANSISTQYFQQFDTFCIIGITQNWVTWFGLQTEWLTSAWNAECRENKIWLEQVLKLIEKTKNLNCNIRRFELGILIIY